MIDWWTADTATTDRLYGRTASFCTSTSNNFDTWDQGLAFFLPNMTWYQPPGYVHVMATQTWAETTVSSTGATFPFSAQRTADGRTLVLRAVNSGAADAPFTVSLRGVTAAGPSATVWTLGGSAFSLGDDNTPADPTKIAPVQSALPLAAGATSLAYTLEPRSFVVFVVALQ